MDFLSDLKQALSRGEISEKMFLVFTDLFTSYSKSLTPDTYELQQTIFKNFLNNAKKEFVNPHQFAPYHSKITSPYDYHAFGIDFIRPMVESTEILHPENLREIERFLAEGDNVVLLANHQTEIDPQILSVALERDFPKLEDEIIWVAGDRVLTDTMAIPFSKGLNLLCIYSKRHIDHPPEKKVEKQLHNQRTMRKMKELLAEGGKFICVAPSGGRDRADANGVVNIAAFDPNNIEMFRLMASQSQKSTHFYSLALATYDILPPPSEIESEIGEMRVAKRDRVFLSVGKEIDFDALYTDIADRHERRIAVAKHVWQLVSDDYKKLLTRKSAS